MAPDGTWFYFAENLTSVIAADIKSFIKYPNQEGDQVNLLELQSLQTCNHYSPALLREINSLCYSL